MSADTHHVPGTALLLGAGAVILVAIIGIALLGSPDVTSYEPGSPEAVAQAYVQALFDDRVGDAFDLMAPALQARCPEYGFGFEHRPDMHRAVFDDVQQRDDTIVITIQISTTDYSPQPLPELSTDTIRSQLVLREVNDEWRIVDAMWPLSSCEWR